MVASPEPPPARSDPMKYLCFAYEEEEKLNELSRDEWAALRQETLDYVDQLKRRGVLIDARPLQSATKASIVRVRNGKTLVTDGPFVETTEQIGGFFLVEAADFDAALEIAAAWPSARIGSIEVRPIDEDLRTDRRY